MEAIDRNMEINTLLSGLTLIKNKIPLPNCLYMDDDLDHDLIGSLRILLCRAGNALKLT